MKIKQYMIFCGDLHITTIETRGAREATIYACGILEGWRYCLGGSARRSQGVTVLDDQGRVIFERKYNS